MKNHTFLLYKLLEMCQIMARERSINGVLNIITGKQNHQTWADVHYYQLQPYYRLLTKEEAEELLTQLIQQKQITIHANNDFTVTEQGNQLLLKGTTNLSMNVRDGTVIPAMEVYWSFLHLLVQTLSNLLQNNKQFLPIVRDVFIQQKVKRWLTSHESHEGAKGLYNDLHDLFSQLPVQISNLLVYRLSGQHRISLSLQQIAKFQNKTQNESRWLWESALTQVYHIISQGNYQYIPKVKKYAEIALSESCQRTRMMLKQGKSTTDISRARGLKKNTVLDHIVEIALVEPDFNHYKYISDTQLEQVKQMYSQFQSFRLKTYKEQLPHLDYFQLRLALAILVREQKR